MFNLVQHEIEEKQWGNIPIQVYFFWNEKKLTNSGQIHIRSRQKIGFSSDDFVDVYIDMENCQLIIINGSKFKPPHKQKANDVDVWRSIAQGNKKSQDFDFKYRPIFNLLNIKKLLLYQVKKLELPSTLDKRMILNNLQYWLILHQY